MLIAESEESISQIDSTLKTSSLQNSNFFYLWLAKPKLNERNLKEIPPKILKSLTIELVDHMDRVLEKAIVVQEGETLFQSEGPNGLCPEVTHIALQSSVSQL